MILSSECDFAIASSFTSRLRAVSSILLVKELAIAKSHSEDKIMEELKTIFAH